MKVEDQDLILKHFFLPIIDKFATKIFEEILLI